MNPLIQLKQTTSVFLLAIAFACFALSQRAQAVLPSPSPDGGYPYSNTAEGDLALHSLTTGSSNTAIGYQALFSNTIGYSNTATGTAALGSNTTGYYNIANGDLALFGNTTGSYNTATGTDALENNTTGSYNTGHGFNALQSNRTGSDNTANGARALLSNTIGGYNTATGTAALHNNISGDFNTATGYQALYHNTVGSNTATGYQALYSNTTGNDNIGLGEYAGYSLTTGSHNIDIGNQGVAGESNKIRIGTAVTHTATFIAGIVTAAVTGTAVVVNGAGKLGVAPSSERFKDAIKPMDKASEAIFSLRPVTFRYKKDIDPQGASQFGLVAEDVEKVASDLVTHDVEGKVFTVRYEAVNAMLLNEFLKEHRSVQEMKTTLGQQQKQIEALTAGLQKVSAQLEVSKSAPQTVLNNR